MGSRDPSLCRACWDVLNHKMLRCVAIFVVALGFVALVADAGCEVSLSDFNAHADGVNYDDEALASALAACSSGGRIVFPPGKYLLSPFNVSSNIELYLEQGSTLLASTDFSRWPIVPALPSYPDVSAFQF